MNWFRKHSQLSLLTLLCLVITLIYRSPDVIAYITTPPGMIFLGQNSWFDPQDITIYASVIHYAQSGHFLLPNLWTAMPNQSILIFPLEQILGYFFRSVNPYFLFWITSIICGILLIICMFRLVRKSIDSDLL